MSSQVNLNANSWSQEMINGVLFGNQVDAESITKALDKSGTNNRLGAFSSIEIGLESALSDNFNVYLGVNDRSLAYSSISRDLNMLLLAGNSQFAGDTMLGDASFLKAMRFQEFKLGFSKMHAGLRWGAGFAVINAEFLQEFNIKTARLYTDEIGSFLSYDVDIEHWQNDSSQNGFMAPNGIGINSDFFIQKENKNQVFTLGLRDLGWITWKQNTRLTRYVGANTWAAQNINLTQNTALAVNLNDSIERISSHRKVMQRSVLPPLLYGRILLKSNKLQQEIYAMWRLNRAFVPWIQYRVSYTANTYVEPYIQTGAGGSGNYFVGLGARFNYSIAHLNMALSNMEGLLMPNQTSGLGGILQLTLDL